MGATRKKLAASSNDTHELAKVIYDLGMSFRSIAITAAVGVALFTLADSALFPRLEESGRFLYNAIARLTLLSFVAVASALAASRFGWWSEYVGRAWTLFFAGYATLAISEIFRRWLPEQQLVGETLVVAANLELIGAYILMARSLSAAGLGMFESRTRKVLVTIAALALALALCYDPIISAAQSLQSGQANFSRLVSPVADVIMFALLAPLLLTAFALRGGQVFWIFAFLTTGTIGWMVNQGSAMVVGLFDGGAGAVRSGRMLGFAMACMFIAAAGFTQWLAAHRAMKGAPRAT